MAKMKKCMKIGLLSAILTAGIVVAVSCSSDDDDTQDNKYAIPDDHVLGNGNYIIHNFIGSEGTISRDTVSDDLNHYLGLAKTYMKDKLNAFDQSLNNRESAKQYFSDFIQGLNNDKYFNYFSVNVNNPSDHNYDRAIDSITIGSEQYLADIMQNLNDVQERLAFDVVYSMMANEADYKGKGKQRTATVYQNGYEAKKEDISLLTHGVLADYHLDQDFDNNYITATNLADELLTTAANNISNRKGIDVRAEDLRQIVNFNLAAHTLAAPHGISTTFWNHKDHCNGALTDLKAIKDNLYTNTYTMSNSQEMGM